jgi:hypothetical protein
MNKNAMIAAFKSCGWNIETDEVGDKVALFNLPDRIVDVIPNLRRVKGEQQLSILPTLSTRQFSDFFQAIEGSNNNYTPLIRAWKRMLITSSELQDEDVAQMSDNAISWAENQNLETGLQELAALPTDAPGARPVWHLGALAVLGDVDRLKSYQASFETGDRLGFVNYVTKDYIDRAVALAEGNSVKA